jgi:hypothetical protein
MMIGIPAAILVGALLSPIALTQQQKAEAQFKLVQFQMAVMKRGPRWTATNTAESVRLHQEHRAYVTSLAGIRQGCHRRAFD